MPVSCENLSKKQETGKKRGWSEILWDFCH